MSRLLWVVHGPNLNLLGEREPGVYGTTTLAQIDADLAKVAKAHGHRLESFQSNHEGALVDRIQSARGTGVDFIINPAAFTSRASRCATRWLRRACRSSKCTCRTSIAANRSGITRTCPTWRLAVIGLGPIGYRLAVQPAIESLRTAGDGRATAFPRKG